MNINISFYKKKYFFWICVILFPPAALILIWSVQRKLIVNRIINFLLTLYLFTFSLTLLSYILKDLTPVSSPTSSESDYITSYIEDNLKQFSSTTLDSITIKKDLNSKDYITLVYLTWNGEKNHEIVKNQSDTLASEINTNLHNIKELQIHWTIENTYIKYSYERKE